MPSNKAAKSAAVAAARSAWHLASIYNRLGYTRTGGSLKLQAKQHLQLARIL